MGVTAVDNGSYQGEVLEADLPVLVDFWGEGCPPCMMIAPIIEELAQEYQGRVKFVKAKAEDNYEQAMKLKIMAVPTLLFYDKGELKDKHVGFASKPKLVDIIKKNFSL